jgi:hypothetical protein
MCLKFLSNNDSNYYSHGLFNDTVNIASNGMMRDEQWTEKEVKMVAA